MDASEHPDIEILMAYLKKLDLIATGLSHECPTCGATIATMRQVGRDVYLEPCGHRLWQGLVPDYWKPGP